MRVLLDESVPRQLAGRLGGHEVTTVTQEGWAGLRNGDLLRRASGRFDVLVTGDQGLQFQQNLSSVRLGIVVVAGQNTTLAPAFYLTAMIVNLCQAAFVFSQLVLSDAFSLRG